jgi:hypothetical protein
MHTRRFYLSTLLAVLACLAAPPAFAQSEIREAGKLMQFQSGGDLYMDGHCFGNVTSMPSADVAYFFNGGAVTNGGNIFFSGPITWNSASFPGNIVFQSGTTNIASISSNSLYLKGKCTNSSSCTNTIWEPTKWNISTVQPYNNCYNYGNDKITNTFAQPGRAHGITLAFPSDMNVTAVRNAALADGLIWVGWSFPGNTYSCGTGHLIFMTVAPLQDYHWMRIDQTTGAWSHKPGGTAATNRDNSSNPISNPLTANRGIYTDNGGFYCTCGSIAAIN